MMSLHISEPLPPKKASKVERPRRDLNLTRRLATQLSQRRQIPRFPGRKPNLQRRRGVPGKPENDRIDTQKW